ncbi:MAG: hypothetical protein JWP69_1768 [Flaviaesturariibacter sp.]|nr:hypothetical protein [Flaviaesturariibacter sp.]
MLTMKNTLFLATALLFASAAVQAQSTADSIKAKYKLLPMPGALTVQKSFPVIGTYQLSNAVEGSTEVTISLDSTNKGIVWVAGLPQGTFKAYLKKAPGTYRILSQKSSTGKQIPEGTLVYDKDANTLNLALGAYNEADPASVFPIATAAIATGEVAEVKIKTKTSKTKSKVTFYTATKVDANTATAQPVSADAAIQQQ